MKNRITVTIAGHEYTFMASETAEYMEKVAAHVDSQLKQVTDMGNMTLTEAAVLCAANLCDETFKTRESAENMRAQLKAYVADASRSKLELAEARREIDRLKNEIEKNRR